MQILNEGLAEGLKVVGERYEDGEYFLVELMLAGETMSQGLKQLEPFLSPGIARSRGCVVLATVYGDVHEIGKNLVAQMLRAAGFKVVDLGVDVPAERIVKAVQEHKAGVVGLSVLLTPSVGQLRVVVEALQAAGLRSHVKVLIGGACTTPALAESLGVDGHGADALAAVRLCEKIFA